MKIKHFKTLESTNGYLKKNYQLLKHQTIIRADEQTHGYGQHQSIWKSNASSLTLSILLKKEINAHMAKLMPLLTAVAVHKVLIHYHQKLSIKWPNDLMCQDKKLAGILCESIILNQDFEALIIGLGLNVNQEKFDQTLMEKATSLHLLTHQSYVISRLASRISKSILNEIKLFKKGSLDYLDYLNHYNYLRNKHIEVETGEQIIKGVAKKITFLGHLELISNEQTIELSEGHIKLI